jgi:hypothetical protein
MLFLPNTVELVDRLASPHRSTSLDADVLRRRFSREIRTLGLFPAAAVVALAGIPIGRRGRRWHRAYQSAARRRLRARIRKRRLGP